MLHEGGAREAFHAVLDGAVMALEAAVVLVIVVAGAQALAEMARRGFGLGAKHMESVRLRFGRALLLALDFAVGSDVIRMATVPSLERATVAGFVVLVRIALTLVLEWELRNARRTAMAENEERQAPSSPMDWAKRTSP